MLDVIAWWVLIELIGLIALPVAFRFLGNLPDRGYAFIKPLGLLLIAYPFWLLTTLGFLTNTQGAIILVAVVVAGLSWSLSLRRTSPRISAQPATGLVDSSSDEKQTVFEWVRENMRVVVSTELVFTLAFLGWALVRSYMPEITATEKPMEFAFLNGVLQSGHFPPLDPWLAGYAISYYYFGYVITAMLTILSGVPSSYAFNLMIALLFALTATGAFGLAHNLIRSWNAGKQAFSAASFQSVFFSLFAPLFILVSGNLEGLFEALHARGIGSSGFWNWLDVKGLATAPTTGSFVPMDNWWWWRASRVVHDTVMGQTQEVIDEFPQFSFLLGDLHPHVLALPFVLLALAIALNLLRSKIEIGGWKLRSSNLELWLLPLVLGGLFFLNSWDILPYGFILVAAFVIARYRASGLWDREATRDAAVFVFALGALSVILYLPFYLSFQSQAGGILPTLFVKTPLHQYLIMFGLFVLVLGAFIIQLFVDHPEISEREWLRRAVTPVSGIIAFPIFVAAFAIIVLKASPYLLEQARAAFPSAADNFLFSVLLAYFGPLISDPWLFVILAVFLSAIFVLAREYLTDESSLFVLMLAFTGFLLTFGVEFVYLRDQFGTRMNTVFKFYFQTWTLLSIASAFAVYVLASKLKGMWRGAWFGGFAVLLGASLIYPALAIPNRANDFAAKPILDGIAWIRETNSDDYAAMQWLSESAPRGAVTLEAVGGEYSYGNRISMATGLPTILGWPGHESQWRGNSNLYKDDSKGIDRAADVQHIYQSIDPQETLTYLDKYAIRFVVVGQTEKNTYGLTKNQIDKFGKIMTLVFEHGDVRIYGR